MGYDEQNDIFLFENDLQEYQVSDEGRAVGKLITYNDFDQLVRKDGVSATELREAFENYWDARNGTGLHYSDQEKLKKAKESDAYEARLYREQN